MITRRLHTRPDRLSSPLRLVTKDSHPKATDDDRA
jgi:hypothetical protein